MAIKKRQTVSLSEIQFKKLIHLSRDQNLNFSDTLGRALDLHYFYTYYAGIDALNVDKLNAVCDLEL